ncbi:hypothetical protein EDD21DRAFT_409943 [Dissophora ornata]|nr:hypothetical protein EDD21DRAFT_409943 [Dissophora ornata]
MKISSIILLSAVAAIVYASEERTQLYAPSRFAQRGLLDGLKGILPGSAATKNAKTPKSDLDESFVKRGVGAGNILSSLPVPVLGNPSKLLEKREANFGQNINDLPAVNGLAIEESQMRKRDSFLSMLKDIPVVGGSTKG